MKLYASTSTFDTLRIVNIPFKTIRYDATLQGITPPSSLTRHRRHTAHMTFSFLTIVPGTFSVQPSGKLHHFFLSVFTLCRNRWHGVR